jgi:uncharacterized protein (DUF58 family)
VRDALAGLTTRGRCFLAAGIALTVCGLGLAERDLVRVGVFIAALPLLAALVVARTRYRMSCERTLDPMRVEAGVAARVVLTMENVSRLPTGVLLVEDTLPYLLGGRPRFVLDRVAPRHTREVTYQVRSEVRGRYPIGPLAVRLNDPFGFCELSRAFRSVDQLIVTPQISRLPRVRLGGDRAGGGESTSRAVAAAGEDDVATREYRYGDDLRRVHWRSTAHAGELMVRREEQPWQSRATVLLDTRMTAHRGDGPTSSFEWAVCAAASIGVHLVRERYSVRLLTDTGAEQRSSGVTLEDAGAPFEAMLLDTLASVRPSHSHGLTAALGGLHRTGEGLVVAVLGELDPDDAVTLARLRRGSTACVAVLMDTTGWTSVDGVLRDAATERFDSSAGVLRGAGWRVIPISYGVHLADVWPLAAASAAGASELTSAGTPA